MAKTLTTCPKAISADRPLGNPLTRAALFELIDEPVLVYNEQGQLIDCNRAARMLACSGEQAEMAAIEATLATRLPLLGSRPAPLNGTRVDYVEDCSEGKRFWRVSRSSLCDCLTPGLLVRLQDVTDLARAEAELKRSNRRLSKQIRRLTGQVETEAARKIDQERLLANQTRLAAMGEMVGAIAHQWRQPLATLAMMIQRAHVLGCRAPLSRDFLDEFKSNALRQIDYMSETIDEFRGFYREGKEKVPFSPLQCITDSLRLFEAQFQAGAILVEVLPAQESGCLVPGYPNEFKQVILNLLSNARDAIVASRAASGQPEQGRVTIEVRSDQQRVTIEITDNGCGIPAAVAPRIFEPYFTTKESSGGTGVGLYVSRTIVEDSLGGSLSLVAGNDGARFRIELIRDDNA